MECQSCGQDNRDGAKFCERCGGSLGLRCESCGAELRRGARTRLDRDVALAVIKTEGLDETSRARITREARDMVRLGDHPHILSIYDMGEEPSVSPGQGGQPYMVLPLIGGDVEGVPRPPEALFS